MFFNSLDLTRVRYELRSPAQSARLKIKSRTRVDRTYDDDDENGVEKKKPTLYNIQTLRTLRAIDDG